MLFLKPSKELEPRQVAVKIKVAHYRFSMLPSPFARRNVTWFRVTDLPIARKRTRSRFLCISINGRRTSVNSAVASNP